MTGKRKKPASAGTTKGKGKGPGASGITLDDAGRFTPEEGELTDDKLDNVSGGAMIFVGSACHPKTPTPPVLRVCCPSVQMCRPKK